MKKPYTQLILEEARDRMYSSRNYQLTRAEQLKDLPSARQYRKDYAAGIDHAISILTEYIKELEQE